MVSAKKGLLLKCDLQTRVLIKHISEEWKKQKNIEVILAELDEFNLLIDPKHLDAVKKELQVYADKITYTIPDARLGEK